MMMMMMMKAGNKNKLYDVAVVAATAFALYYCSSAGNGNGNVVAVNAFGIVPPASLQPLAKTNFFSPMELSTTVLFPIRCYDKYYQLEELEDRDTCTTELFLTEDGNVEFGDTDGPVYTNAVGHWEVKPNTNDYTMYVTRTYNAGIDNTDMGSFTFDTTRTFIGEMTLVGASVAIAGITKSKDTSLTDENVDIGYFNMIDATKERLGEEDEEDEEDKFEGKISQRMTG